jgi:hypothetical protein
VSALSFRHEDSPRLLPPDKSMKPLTRAALHRWIADGRSAPIFVPCVTTRATHL